MVFPEVVREPAKAANERRKKEGLKKKRKSFFKGFEIEDPLFTCKHRLHEKGRDQSVEVLWAAAGHKPIGYALAPEDLADPSTKLCVFVGTSEVLNPLGRRFFREELRDEGLGVVCAGGAEVRQWQVVAVNYCQDQEEDITKLFIDRLVFACVSSVVYSRKIEWGRRTRIFLISPRIQQLAQWLQQVLGLHKQQHNI